MQLKRLLSAWVISSLFIYGTALAGDANLKTYVSAQFTPNLTLRSAPSQWRAIQLKNLVAENNWLVENVKFPEISIIVNQENYSGVRESYDRATARMCTRAASRTGVVWVKKPTAIKRSIASCVSEYKVPSDPKTIHAQILVLEPSEQSSSKITAINLKATAAQSQSLTETTLSLLDSLKIGGSR